VGERRGERRWERNLKGVSERVRRWFGRL